MRGPTGDGLSQCSLVSCDCLFCTDILKQYFRHSRGKHVQKDQQTTYLQCTIQKAAILSRLIAESFTRCYRCRIAWCEHSLHTASSHGKIIPLPRHLSHSALHHPGVVIHRYYPDQVPAPMQHKNGAVQY